MTRVAELLSLAAAGIPGECWEFLGWMEIWQDERSGPLDSLVHLDHSDINKNTGTLFAFDTEELA